MKKTLRMRIKAKRGGTKKNSKNNNNNNNIYKNLTYHDDIFNEPYGVFTHTDCWKFIKKEYGK